MQLYRYRWRNVLPILIQRYHEISLLLDDKWNEISYLRFEVRHPRCVTPKSNYKVYAYIVKHNYI
jgi:hypothetical protein